MADRKLLVHSVIGVLLCWNCLAATPQQSQQNEAEASVESFVMGPWAISMPTGALLVIRKNGKVGALRLTAVVQGDAIGLGTATYESYFQGDGSANFQRPNVTKLRGEIELKPLKGVGRFSFQTGKNKIRVGSWSFGAAAPNLMNMWPFRGDSKDYGFEFAPTSARDISELNLSDPRLRWFKFDSSGGIVLPVRDLPK